MNEQLLGLIARFRELSSEQRTGADAMFKALVGTLEVPDTVLASKKLLVEGDDPLPQRLMVAMINPDARQYAMDLLRQVKPGPHEFIVRCRHCQQFNSFWADQPVTPVKGP